jgi:hypothetical protein
MSDVANVGVDFTLANHYTIPYCFDTKLQIIGRIKRLLQKKNIFSIEIINDQLDISFYFESLNKSIISNCLGKG